MKRLRIHAAVAIVTALAACNCGGKDKSQTGPRGTSSVAGDGVLVQDSDLPDGLALRLSDGKEPAPRSTRVTPARATRLGQAETQALLGRLSPLAARADDQKDFALRERSQPPPRTGDTIKGVFPPAGGAAPPPATGGQKLTVQRFAPEGEVPLAPNVNVTFSLPMVAVTSQTDAARTVPVQLTPQPAGSWRWLGTRTLVFQPDTRMPQATAYQVKVPAGTKAADGTTLAEEVTFSFETPAPRMLRSHPTSSPQDLEVGMFVLFDQRIDAKAIIDAIRIEAGSQTLGARALTADEIAATPHLKSLVDGAIADDHGARYVAFRADRTLPKDTNIAVTIPRGTPSAEGPLKTTSDQSFSFRTYAPLAIEEARCSWGNECPPGAPFMFRFNNPLDPESLDSAQVQATPEIPGMKVRAQGQYLYVEGRTKGRTSYQVTIPAALADTFGQTLGKDETRSFQTGSAHPYLTGPQGMVVLDPVSKAPTFDVFSMNQPALRVQLYTVAPADWATFAEHQRNPYDRQSRAYRDPPFKKVFDEKVSTKKAVDELVESRIDLSPALQNGLGHAIVVVESTVHPRQHLPQRLTAWVQATRIGLDASTDSGEMVAWANRLADGEPLADVQLEIAPYGIKTTTGADGIARVKLASAAKKGVPMLLARSGADVAFLPEFTHWWASGGSWHQREQGKSLTWYVADDRKMYRPGEKVHLKGWLRIVDYGEGGDVVGPGTVRSVQYKVVGPRGNEIGKGTAKVNALGGFDTAFELPKTPNLGWATVQLTAVGTTVNGTTHGHGFQIQEFRRPEFEVTTETSQGPHMVGGHAEVTVEAKYYAGGALPGAEVRWWVNTMPGSFTPPDRDDWQFGRWSPWWGYWRPWGEPEPSGHSSLEHQAKTDAGGKHVLRMDFLSAKPALPMQVVAQATVMDVNRQAWTSSETLLVHPAEVYIGLKADKPFVERGEPIELQAIVVDHDGKVATGKKAVVRAVRLDWEYKNGEYRTVEADPQECSFASGGDAEKCTFQTPEGGQYKITAGVVDDAGRPSTTEMIVYVSGGQMPPSRNVEQERVTLVPDKKEYAPGDAARLLVQAPFSPAEGILTVRRAGIVEARRFQLSGPTTTLEVPIVDAHTPNVYVQVDLVGAAGRPGDDGKVDPALPKRPAFATGMLNLPVPPKHRALSVKVAPAKRKLEPGGSTTLDLHVRDALSRPVAGAELAVIVVDESVLSLSGYTIPDPLGVFYPERSPGAQDYHSRAMVTLASPEGVMDQSAAAEGGMEEAEMAAEAPMDDAVGGAPGRGAAPTTAAPPPSPRMRKSADRSAVAQNQAPTPIAVRTDFSAIATFAPEVKTDAQGKARITVKVPDNLTRYRVMVAAVAGERLFGKGESSITARMPLMVRPSPPRFLNFGDRFELPVVLQNQTDAPMQVSVAVRASNAALTDGQGRMVTVPANDRVEVRFPAAAEMPGTARLQLAATAGPWSDAAELSLPVWTPATTEAFATYGEIDSGAIAQKIQMPGEVVREFGGLEITTSSTQLQALTDAFLYLVSYPYECSEQISSRIIAIAALRDVLTEFQVEQMPEPAALKAQVAADLDKLAAMQNADGGFAFWSRGFDSWPYLTIHVANALARARDKGFEVPQSMIDRALGYLKSIERHIPHWYPPQVRNTIIAYALHTRSLHGDRDLPGARALFEKGGGTKDLTMEALGWLLGVMAKDPGSKSQRDAIHRHLANKASETAAAATFSTAYDDGGYLILHSSRRADGIVLDALIADRPGSDLIPKVVRGLLAHRTRGRWGNTQENSFVLLALDRYFQVFEKVTPNFVARAWLGDGFAGEHRFRGRTTERHHIDVPMDYVAKLGETTLTLAKQGKGRMYYRIGMTYAPKDLRLPAADYGFAVERIYEAVDDPGDVMRKADGTWKIKAGARVRVRLTMVAQSRRYHVALVDPLPAGLEPVNPALAVSGQVPADPKAQQGSYWWWTRTWYEHQNMRDERVEAFTSLLWAGVHEYTYVARATTPGNFVVPPTKAEEMYTPETFGRSASDRVVVE